MKKSIRKNITQASLNLSNWWFVSLEILIASIAISTYLDNVYIFPLSLALLLLFFYNKYTSIYISAFFALFWAFVRPTIVPDDSGRAIGASGRLH